MKKIIKKSLSILLTIAMISTLLVACDNKKKNPGNNSENAEIEIPTKDYSAEVQNLSADTAKVYIALATQTDVYSYVSANKYLSSAFSFEINEIGNSIENGQALEGLKISAETGITNGYMNLSTAITKGKSELFNLSFGATDKCLLLSSSLLNGANYKIDATRIMNEFSGSELEKALMGMEVPMEALNSIPSIASALSILLPQLTNPETIESTLAALSQSMGAQTETVDPEAFSKLFEDIKKAITLSEIEKEADEDDVTLYKVTLTKDAAQLMLNSIYENIITPVEPNTKAPTIMDYEEASMLVGVAKDGSLSSIEINDEESGGKLHMSFSSNSTTFLFLESSEDDAHELSFTISYVLTKDTYTLSLEELNLVVGTETLINLSASFAFSTAPIEVPNVSNYADILDIDPADYYNLYVNFATNLAALAQYLNANLGM